MKEIEEATRFYHHVIRAMTRNLPKTRILTGSVTWNCTKYQLTAIGDHLVLGVGEFKDVCNVMLWPFFDIKRKNRPPYDTIALVQFARKDPEADSCPGFSSYVRVRFHAGMLDAGATELLAISIISRIVHDPIGEGFASSETLYALAAQKACGQLFAQKGEGL